MAILLRQLCEKASYLYGMRILAGENGTGNIVQWIHTLEDVETGGLRFLIRICIVNYGICTHVCVLPYILCFTQY